MHEQQNFEAIETGWRTLLELDRERGASKGCAFRAFRRIEANWIESTDFHVLHHERNRALIDLLRQQGRIYASTVNMLLLSPALATAVLDQMRRMTTEPTE